MKKKNKTPIILRVIGWIFPKLENISPWLAKRWFVSIFFTPVRYKLPAEEKEIAADGNTYSVNYNNQKIQVYEWGEGQPVLFVHGWMGRGTQFRKFVPVFTQQGYKVVTFDAPGHGRSEGKKSHIMHFTNVINQLGAHYNFVLVVGHSLGGVAAMHALVENSFARKLIMISSPTIAEKIVDEFLRRLNASPAMTDYFYQYVKQKFGKPFEEYSASHAIQYLQNIELLLIHDEDDKEVTLENPKVLLSQYKSSDLITTSGLGHTRILKDDYVIQTCLSFAHAPIKDLLNITLQ